jgi:hypothetical protein
MTHSSELEIVRREDGSIRIEHYLARARRQRSGWFTASLRAMWHPKRAAAPDTPGAAAPKPQFPGVPA